MSIAAKTMKVDGLVLIDDGLIALEVEAIDPQTLNLLLAKALNGGPIKKNKGVNLPGMELDLPALTEKDKNDLRWACEVGADYVAASFIRTPACKCSFSDCILGSMSCSASTNQLRTCPIASIGY